MRKRDIREYRLWSAMKARCYAPCNRDMGYYQQDGITVCVAWRNSFDDFIADMGYAPTPKHSLDRIDNLQGYCKANCRWIPISEQSKNRRNVPLYSYGGYTKTLKDWARTIGMNYDTLRMRVVRKNRPFVTAIETPVKCVNKI